LGGGREACRISEEELMKIAIDEIFRVISDNIANAKISEQWCEGFTGAALLGWYVTNKNKDLWIKIFNKCSIFSGTQVTTIGLAKTLDFYHTIYLRDFPREQANKIQELVDERINAYYKEEREKRENKRRRILEEEKIYEHAISQP
jgi:TusA-related sulfurtransferase